MIKNNLDQSKLAYKTCNLSSKTIIIPWKENQKNYNAKFPTIQIQKKDKIKKKNSINKKDKKNQKPCKPDHANKIT